MLKLLSLLLGLALISTACGGSDDLTDPTSLVDDVTETTAQGGSDDVDTQADESGSLDGGSAQGLPPGGTGTVDIDGKTIQSEWVGNCLIDEQFDPHPADLDLTASLGGIQALFLEISNRSLPMGPEPYEYLQLRASLQIRTESGDLDNYETVFVTGPEGEWYEDGGGAVAFTLARGEQPEAAPLATPPLILEEGRASGTVALEGSESPIVVTYDLNFIEPVDCSL